MRKSEFIDRLYSNKLSRRDFTRALSAAGLALTAMPMVGRQAMAADHFARAMLANPRLQRNTTIFPLYYILLEIVWVVVWIMNIANSMM